MEAILEAHLLDDAQSDLIKALASSVRVQQTAKAPVTRMNHIAEEALRTHASWLELQDIPQPIVRSQRAIKESPRLSPVAMDKGARRAVVPPMSPLSSPLLLTATKPPPPKASFGDDIFSMEDDAVPTLNIGQSQSPPAGYTLPPPAWKSKPAQTPTRYVLSVMQRAF